MKQGQVTVTSLGTGTPFSLSRRLWQDVKDVAYNKTEVKVMNVISAIIPDFCYFYLFVSSDQVIEFEFKTN